MPTPRLDLLKATRIQEARTKVEEAKSEVESAERAVRVAVANRDAATATGTDAEKAQAEQQLSAANEALAEARQRAEYEHTQLNCLLGKGGFSLPPGSLQYLVFGLLALTVVCFLGYGMVTDRLLPKLATIATARGLITFLITVVTVTIALILVLATVVSDSADREQRFLNGKDLLTALIGVLGTVVGYYFGQSQETDKVVTVAPAYISTYTPKEGESIMLVSFASGGRLPYTYDIVFEPNVIPEIKQAQSADGQVAATITAPKVDADKEVYFTIKVKDAVGKEASFDSRTVGKKLVLKKP